MLGEHDKGWRELFPLGAVRPSRETRSPKAGHCDFECVCSYGMVQSAHAANQQRDLE